MPKPIRVAVLGLRGIPGVQGGIEKHCLELYPRLAQMGVAVSLLARKGYVPDHPFVFQGVNVVPLPVLRRKSTETLFHTLVCLCWLTRNRSRFDIVHIHGIGPALFAPVLRLLGFKVVVTSHGADYNRRKWRFVARFGLRLGEYLGVRYAHAVIAVARHIREQLERQYNCPAVVIPNGALTPSGLRPGGELLLKLGLRPGRYILAVGRYVPEKGFLELLRAVARLDADHQLVIAGSAIHEDGYTARLRKRAAGLENVVLAGFLPGDQLDVLYQHASLLVLPSSHEGMSLALLEALAHGLPVLVSDIPANREVGLPEERYFTCGDEDELLQKMQRLLAEGMDERERQANMRLIAEKYNWDRIAEQTVEVYEKVLSDED